jgi:hypothetical protein
VFAAIGDAIGHVTATITVEVVNREVLSDLVARLAAR